MIYSVFNEAQKMTYRFILVNEKINPSREVISIVDRTIGEIFLLETLGRMAPEYSGYIIMSNHTCLCAQWLLPSDAVGPVERTLHGLNEMGYSGEIWQSVSDFAKQESVRIA
jgi:hypothetical protein